LSGPAEQSEFTLNGQTNAAYTFQSFTYFQNWLAVATGTYRAPCAPFPFSPEHTELLSRTRFAMSTEGPWFLVNQLQSQHQKLIIMKYSALSARF